jgi:hypothetical protein
MSAHAQLVAKAKAYDQLRSLLGHVQNGSDTPVAINQDDATNSFIIRVGRDGRFFGSSLMSALTQAFEETPRDE